MGIDTFILKFIRRYKRPRIANTVLKEDKVGGLALPDLKLPTKLYIIKTVWHWQKNRQ